MAKYFKFSVLLLIISTICSCTNSDDIGDLLGQWKLEQITYNGVSTQPEDLYLRFQSQYVEALIVNRNQITGHYTQDGNTMTLKFYYPEESFGDLNTSYNFYNDTSIPRTQEEIDKNVNPLNIRFNVETLNSDHLILSNNNGRWIFSKW